MAKAPASKQKGLRAAIYTRISDARGDDQAGIDRQRKDCQELCANNGWEVIGIFEDNNVSAMQKDLRQRPQGKRLMAEIEEGNVDVVVVWATDRLYRRVAELDYLVEALHRTEVATVKSGEVDLTTADGRMIARIMGSVAQHSSEKSGERISRAAMERALEGKFGGGTRRFGYNANCTALNKPEAAALKWAYKEILAGGSINKISAEWVKRVGTGADGGKITSQQVRHALMRPMNAGLAFYKGVEVGKSKAPVIIDEDTWRKVYAILSDPNRISKAGPKPKLLLSGVLRCSVCGSKFSGSYRKDRLSQGIYRCIGCHVFSRSRAYLDDNVTELLLRHIESSQTSVVEVPVDDSRMAVDRELSESLRSKLHELDALVERDELSIADFARLSKKLRAQLEEVNARISKFSPQPAASRMATAENVREAWAKADSDTRREIVNAYIDHINVTAGSSGNLSMQGIDVVWRAA